MALLELKDAQAIDVYALFLKSDNPEMRFKAAKTVLDLKEPFDDNLKAPALKIMNEDAYITATSLYNPNGQPVFTALFNVEGEQVVRKNFIFNKYNSKLVSKETLIVKDKPIHVTEYDSYGKPKKPIWLCFDKNGNIIEKNGNPIFVNTFKAEQKSKIEDRRSLGRILSRSIKIFPCKNCAESTQISNCKYVW